MNEGLLPKSTYVTAGNHETYVLKVNAGTSGFREENAYGSTTPKTIGVVPQQILWLVRVFSMRTEHLLLLL